MDARQQKYQRKAESFVEPGERVEGAVDGFSSLRGRLLGLLSYSAFARIVLVTDKNVFVCKRSPVMSSASVIARYPRNSVKMELRGSHLHVGDEHTLLIMPWRKRSAQDVVQAANAPE